VFFSESQKLQIWFPVLQILPVLSGRFMGILFKYFRKIVHICNAAVLCNCLHLQLGRAKQTARLLHAAVIDIIRNGLTGFLFK